ncbi:MAG: hypothetical protein ACP5NI_11705, partial [Acetobacteraceae bacterium]
MSEAPPESEPPTIPPRSSARHDRLPMLVLVGWMVLAIGLIWLWRHPSANGAAAAKAIAALEVRVAAAEKNGASLAAALAGVRTELAAAAAREGRLGLRLDGLVAGQSAARQDSARALAALAKRLKTALGALRAAQDSTAARVGALEKRPSAAAALAAAETA